MLNVLHDPDTGDAMTGPGDWARLGLVPGKVLRAFGMRRSGNHAIADWLLRNAPSNGSVFLNNCVARRNPLGNFRSIAVNGRQHGAKPALADLPGTVRAAGEGALLLITYEDTSPAEMSARRAISGDFDEGLIDADLVICRSFLNWSASLLKKLQGNDGYALARRCAIVLRAVDSYARMLSLVEARNDLNLTVICYDDWMADAAYRAGILTTLGIEPRDNALGEVQSYGGGSSFQKQAADADELDTNRRWRQMVDDPEYRAILYLCARDAALTDRLARVFPKDAARLQDLAAQMTLSGAALP